MSRPGTQEGNRVNSDGWAGCKTLAQGLRRLQYPSHFSPGLCHDVWLHPQQSLPIWDAAWTDGPSAFSYVLSITSILTALQRPAGSPRPQEPSLACPCGADFLGAHPPCLRCLCGKYYLSSCNHRVKLPEDLGVSYFPMYISQCHNLIQ